MKTVPVPPSVRSIDLVADVTKLCPFRPEYDRGRLHIWFEPDGKTFELHALSRRLLRYGRIAISHEDLVDEMLLEVVRKLKPVNAMVKAEFTTADIAVEVKARYRRDGV